MKVAELIGRTLFGGFFLYSGINHFKNVKRMAQYTASKKVPYAEQAVELSGGMLVFGGASILFGFKPQLGAAAIAAFLVGVSPIMHDFWTHHDPQQRQNDMIHFLKNMAILGAALMILGSRETETSGVPRIAA